MHRPESDPRYAVLVSGTGRSLQNLLRLERLGALKARCALVISSRPNAKALDHAKAYGIEAQVLSSESITGALDSARADFVVMAGYLKHWDLPDRYVGRTINIHPSLLPSFGGKGFYGARVHEAVIESGVRVTGCTVHFVNREYDRGPIIAQRVVKVSPTDDADTLAHRVFEAELDLLPAVLNDVVEGRVRYVEGRSVYDGAFCLADFRGRSEH